MTSPKLVHPRGLSSVPALPPPGCVAWIRDLTSPLAPPPSFPSATPGTSLSSPGNVSSHLAGGVEVRIQTAGLFPEHLLLHRQQTPPGRSPNPGKGSCQKRGMGGGGYPDLGGEVGKDSWRQRERPARVGGMGAAGAERQEGGGQVWKRSRKEVPT